MEVMRKGKKNRKKSRIGGGEEKRVKVNEEKEIDLEN